MTEARDVEEIVAAFETDLKNGGYADDNLEDSLNIGEVRALIADWRAKKAEIEWLRTSRDLAEKELDVLSASHKDLAHRLAALKP